MSFYNIYIQGLYAILAIHYKSNANLIFFLRSITFQKGIAKIYTTILITKTYFQFLVLFFVFFCRCMWFLSSTLKSFSFKDQANKVEPSSHRFLLANIRVSRFPWNPILIRRDEFTLRQQDQKDNIVVEVSGIAASKRNGGGRSQCGTALLEIISPFLSAAFFIPPQQHGFSLPNRRYILWYTSRSKPSEFRLRR